ncbi:hypothetical protein [Nocardioides caldifontis]|uniref:hypothetical protein n=1 Tax=Nocardioides caldifontis TaxID=2588938 RepID=UPI0011DF1104|nr:hypothetical protein [Nocardioides caldifontis]
MAERASASELVELRDVELAGRLLDSWARRDDLLRRLLMLAVVPRIVDRELLAALTGTTAEDDRFAGGYARLVGSPFVKEGAGSSFTLHDELRRPLLELWEEQGFEGRSLADLRRTVWELWEGRYRDGCRDEGALDLVAPVLRRANPRRFRAADRAIRKDVDHALLETVAAAVAYDPAVALDRLDGWLADRAARQEYRRCDLVARSFADALVALPGERRTAVLEGWAAYYRARAAGLMEDWETADDWLDDADGHAAADARLAFWVASLRVDHLVRRDRLVEAQETAEALVARHAGNPPDPWNENVVHGQLATVHENRWQPDEAVASYRAATASATAAGNTAAAVQARLSLTRVVQDAVTAAEEVLRAVATSRLECPDRGINQRASRRALVVLGWESPRLAAALVREVRQLTRGDGPQAVVDLAVDRASTFEAAGLAHRAVEVLDKAITDAAELAPERVPDLKASRAALGDRVGRAEDAVALNLSVIADPLVPAGAWQRARCLTNAALSLLETSQAGRALELALQAQPLFAEIGNERAAAYLWTVRSEAHRLLGDLEEARRCLDRITMPLPAWWESDARFARSRLAAAQGDRDGAAVLAREGYELVRDRDDRHLRLTACSEALHRAARAGRHADVAALGTEVSALAAAATAYETWQPTETTLRADEHLAEAVRIWKAGIGTDRMRLRSAHEHCAESLGLDGASAWAHVEAALIDLARGERPAATHQLEAALDLGEPVFSAALRTVAAELTA